MPSSEQLASHRSPRTRRSTRLRDYDYAQPGMYFFTVCTHKREALFGEVTQGEMRVNDLGDSVWQEWHNSATVRPEVQLDAFMVVLNHAHGVILLKGPGFVRATGGSPFSSGPSKYSLGAFIAGFKAASTKRIKAARRTPKAPVWQRNYYDHIVRDERSLTRMREYILNNPLKWDFDQGNPNKKGDRPVAPTAFNNRYGTFSERRQ